MSINIFVQTEAFSEPSLVGKGIYINLFYQKGSFQIHHTLIIDISLVPTKSELILDLDLDLDLVCYSD